LFVYLLSEVYMSNDQLLGSDSSSTDSGVAVNVLEGAGVVAGAGAGAAAVVVKKPRARAAKPKAGAVAVQTGAGVVAGMGGVAGGSGTAAMGRPLVAPIAGSVGRVEAVYDAEAERAALADFAESGDDYDVGNPLFLRLLRLREHDAAVARTQSFNKLRQHADPLITDAEAAQMNKFGPLSSGDDDYIQIHTKEAFRLFIGRLDEDEIQRRGAISGRKVAAALRFLWLLTSNDNPYADWALLQVEHKCEELRKLLKAVCDKHGKELSDLKKRGLSYSVMEAQKPQRLSLGFRSPYGYLIAELIVDFDYSVRLIKTMVAKNRLSRLEGRSKCFELFRVVRSLFERIVPMQRMLQRADLVALCRNDWLTGDVVAHQRVQMVLAVLGECPRPVFTGELIPRHTRRNGDRLSLLEVAALRTVHLDGSDADLPVASGQESGLV
jgi:integrating conjugative element protein (TIGR03761 family)